MFSSIVQTTEVRCKGEETRGVPGIMNACSASLECSAERDGVVPIWAGRIGVEEVEMSIARPQATFRDFVVRPP